MKNGGYSAIVEKTKQTRLARGDYEELSKKVKDEGIGYYHTCEFCGKVVQGGNFKRWHGENCKKNPNITEEQLKKKESHIIKVKNLNKKVNRTPAQKVRSLFMT